MNLSEEILEKIERFTKGQMDAEEKAAFEVRLANDKALQEQLELSRIVDEMVVGRETLKLREEMEKDLNPSRPGYFKFIILITLLFLAGIFYWRTIRTQEIKENSVRTIQPQSKVAFQTENNPINSKAPVDAKKEGEKLIQKIPKQKSPVVPLVENGDKKEVLKNVEKSALKVSPLAPLTEANEKKNLLPAVQEYKNPCQNFKAYISFHTTASCKGEATGKVHPVIERLEGGLEPYIFRLGDRYSRSYFDSVPAGLHELSITDGHQCQITVSREVNVKEIVCRKNDSYIFNPQYDHNWSIPYNKEKSPVALKIMDKSGVVFYQVAVHDFYPSSWSGESSSGVLPEVGLYFFTIEYSDQSVDEGSLLISR